LEEDVKNWKVYSEGFSCTGEFCPAAYEGAAQAETFKEACQIVLGKKASYDPIRNTLWAMRLFDNATDAERFLGHRAINEPYQKDKE
jgi:hypothetical protein